MALPQGLSLRRCQKAGRECQETANQHGKEQSKICSVFSLTPNPAFLPERILAAGCSWKAFDISALIVVGAAHVHIGLQVWSDALLPHPIVLFCAFVVFGHHSLLQQHCKGRERAAPALLVCRARIRLLLLVLNKWSQSKKQTNKQKSHIREKRELKSF